MEITTQPIGTDSTFLEVFADGKHVGYLSYDVCNGWEARKGTEWPESVRIGTAFRLDRAKELFRDGA